MNTDAIPQDAGIPSATPTAPSAPLRRTRAGRIPPGVLALAAGFATLVDWLFVGHPAGWTTGLLGFLLLSAVLLRPSSAPPHRARALLTAGILLLCLRCAHEPNPTALVLIVTGLAMLALSWREGWDGDPWLWIQRGFDLVTRGWARSLRPLAEPFLAIRRCVASGGAGRSFRLWALPVALGAVFLMLFAAANPVIGRALSSAWKALANCPIPDASGPRILLWFATATLVAALLHHVTGIEPAATGGADPADRGGGILDAMLPPGTVRRSLILFNLLFGVQTVLDILYLWGGTLLPEGMTHAEYVHRGAYPLVAAALLAGAFVLAAFRDRPDAATGRIETVLVHLWLGQTLLLTVASAWRLWLYVDTYSLTRLRLAAIVWVTLVALGLFWIAIRIADGRSSQWLLRVNAISAVLALFGVAMTGVDVHIANYNVRHCAEVMMDGRDDLDVSYLRTLGADAMPALIWIESSVPDHPNAPEWRDAIDEVSRPLEYAMSDWRGWTFQRAGAHAAWKAWMEERSKGPTGQPRVEDRTYGSGLNRVSR